MAKKQRIDKYLVAQSRKLHDANIVETPSVRISIVGSVDENILRKKSVVKKLTPSSRDVKQIETILRSFDKNVADQLVRLEHHVGKIPATTFRLGAKLDNLIHLSNIRNACSINVLDVGASNHVVGQRHKMKESSFTDITLNVPLMYPFDRNRIFFFFFLLVSLIRIYFEFPVSSPSSEIATHFSPQGRHNDDSVTSTGDSAHDEKKCFVRISSYSMARFIKTDPDSRVILRNILEKHAVYILYDI